MLYSEYTKVKQKMGNFKFFLPDNRCQNYLEHNTFLRVNGTTLTQLVLILNEPFMRFKAPPPPKKKTMLDSASRTLLRVKTIDFYETPSVYHSNTSLYGGGGKLQ